VLFKRSEHRVGFPRRRISSPSRLSCGGLQSRTEGRCGTGLHARGQEVLDTIRQVCLSHACILLDIPARCSCPSFPPHSTAVEPPDQSSTAHSFQLLKPASRHYRRGISGPSLPTYISAPASNSLHSDLTTLLDDTINLQTPPGRKPSPLIPISTSVTNMGVEKIMLKPGDGVTTPKKHDEVSMEYTGSPTISSPSSSLTHIQAGSTTSMHQTRRAFGERTHCSLSHRQ
jgi:hypothetical protein